MSKNNKPTGKRIRAYNVTRTMRAIVLGLVLTPLAVTAILWATSSKPAPQPALTGAGRHPQFSQNYTDKDLVSIFKDATVLADTRFVERDKVEKTLARLKKEYKTGTINSKAQLDQALVDYLASLNDRYAAIISPEEYRDLMVRMSGQEVGIELNFNMDSATNNWVVQQMPQDGPAAQAGLQVGDVLVMIEGYHIEELKKLTQGNPGQAFPILLNQFGNLGSMCKITVRRGSEVFDFEVERTVIKTNPSITIQNSGYGYGDPYGGGYPYGYPYGGGMRVENGQLVGINHMGSPNFVQEFESMLKKLNEDGVKGIAFDVANVQGGDGDVAIQAAAMLIESGVVAHKLEPAGEDAIIMKTYFVKDGKVHVTTKGPYRKTPDGKLAVGKDTKETTEATNWSAGIFKGEVVLGINGETMGAAELFVAAVQKNRHAMVVGMDVSFGKGMSVTYVPISPDHVVRFSTGVYLQPDGASIEKRGVMPNVGAEQEFQYTQFLMQLLQQRLKIVPLPEMPVKPSVKK